MPATDIPVNVVVRTGSGIADPTPATADNVNNNSFINDGRTMLRLTATSGTPTLTVVTPGTVDGNAVADVVYTLSTSVVFVGPFPTEIFGSVVTLIPSANTVRITPFRT